MGNYLFRCDVSPHVGTGHLRRCLVLAEELKERGATIFFSCRYRELDVSSILGSVCDYLLPMNWNFSPVEDVNEVVRLCRRHQIDVVVIDHYRADVPYQLKLYESNIRWLQFDGCVQKQLWADWVVNPTLAAMSYDYDNVRQRSETQFFLGPSYAFIRKEFHKWQKRANFREKVEKILFTFGGGDDRGGVIFTLEASKFLQNDIERVLLVSSCNPRLSEIESWIRDNKHINSRLLVDEPEIARNMAQTDLAFIAGGSTAYEAAAMGLPSLIIQIANNQKNNTQALDKAGIAINLGMIDELKSDVLRQHLINLCNDQVLRQNMHHAGMAIVDCMGAERVTRILLDADFSRN